jgi:hypothetical protein
LRAAVLTEKRLLAVDETRRFSEMEYYLVLLRYLERKERKEPERFRKSFKKIGINAAQSGITEG